MYQFQAAILMSRPNRKRPQWLESFRFYLNGLRIKSLAARGHGVVVVGPCGSGKSYLLSKAFPGKLLQPDLKLMEARRRLPLEVETLPDDTCAVDESGYYDWPMTRPSFPALRERKVVFTAQSVGQLLEMGLADLWQERLLIVFLGTREQLFEQCRVTPRLFRCRVFGKDDRLR